MTTEDDFRRELNANPANTDTLLVFADWLDENGGKWADGYRAIGVRRLWPWFYSGSQCWGWWDADYTKTYSDVKQESWGRIRNFHSLPYVWFRAVPRSRHAASNKRENTINTPDFEPRYGPFVLFKAAARGFCSLPSDRRAELLSLTP